LLELSRIAAFEIRVFFSTANKGMMISGSLIFVVLQIKVCCRLTGAKNTFVFAFS
jgi:hypothetical protein